MRSLAALLGVSIVVATGYALFVWAGSGYMGPANAALLSFQFTFLLGLAPVVIYGAPLYAWLQRNSLLTLPRVAALGALPGAIAVPFSVSLGATALACGVAVSCITHRLSKDDVPVRSNISLERTRDR